MLIDNRLLVRTMNEHTYTRIVAWENTNIPNTIVVEPSRNGADTLAIRQEEKVVYIHSKYDPLREIEGLLGQFENLEQYQHAFIIGIGLGYHIDQLIQHNPTIQITIYEPNEEILYHYLRKKKLPKNIVQIFTTLHDLTNLEQLAKDFSQTTMTVILPAYMRLYRQQIEKTQEDLIKLLKHVRNSLGVNVSLQQLWITNSLLNYPKTIKTSNIISKGYQQIFEDKPVIIVAAGPSLNNDLELLRVIKEEGTAYIFAVGSAINTLLNEKIIPHAVFSYDPSTEQYKVIQKIKDEQVGSIPLVYGTSVGFATLVNYPGKLVHMVTSADTLSRNILKIPTTQVIEDSPSIAVMALQVAKKLNMTPIILAGQNLGFLNNTRYAEGINYDWVTSELTEKEKENTITIKDVHGQDMLSNDTFISMKQGLEVIIQSYPYGQVINTTKNGAHINGAEFKSLSVVKEEYLTERNIVLTDWVIEESSYKQGIEKFNAILDNYKQMLIDLDRAVMWANKVRQDYDAKIYTKIHTSILEFNKIFKKIIESDAHQFIIKAGIKVQNQKFMNEFKKVEFEKKPKKKAEKFIDIMYTYLGSIYEFTKIIQPTMEATEWQLKNNKDITIS